MNKYEALREARAYIVRVLGMVLLWLILLQLLPFRRHLLHLPAVSQSLQEVLINA